MASKKVKTVAQIAALETREKAYKVAVDTGLLLRVAHSGVKSWIVLYTVKQRKDDAGQVTNSSHCTGRQREYLLPKPWAAKSDEKSNMSLAEARGKAAEIRALARDGIDFQVMRAESEKAAVLSKAREQAKDLTVKALFDEWLEDDVKRKDGGAELRRSFGVDVFPKIGDMPVREVNDRHIRTLLKKIVERGANRHAVMVLGDLKQMFRYAGKNSPWKKLIEDNPVEHIDARKITSADYEGNKRSRTLSAVEVKELANKLPDAGLLKRTELAIWIMLSCCCRIGEIIRAKWEHVDLDNGVWIIPKENAKNKVAHTVYLSDFSLSYFRQLREQSGKSAWCYPDATDKKYVCVKSTTKQIRDRQMAAMNRKPMKNRSKSADALMLSGGDWVPHDLRRTGATMMQALGVTPEVIERVLNHVEKSAIKTVYQTYDYAKEKREAWRLLGDRLALLVNPPENLIVGDFKGAA